MLIRISLIVAIIAGLAVGTINFLYVKKNITTLRTDLKQQTDRGDTAERNLASTKKELDKTVVDLKQTKDTLETTVAERDKAVALADEKVKAAAKLTDDITKMQADLSDARSKLAAYEASGLSSAQAANAAKQIKQLEDTLAGAKAENVLLGKTIKRLENELAIYKDPNKPISLPANLAGKVLISDPKWDFVVLNVGEDQGVLERGELLVSRNGKLVGKVKITSVQKDRSIANVIPGWKIGEVLEGDQVIPAYPSAS
ncbi:MAG: hypothetical protein QOD03_550 [Verrucomicrobiota bacterium]|jgi:hypothetical protein